jgi:hypothetical protein
LIVSISRSLKKIEHGVTHDMARDMNAILDEVQDPDHGLAWLSKLLSGEKTPEQEHDCVFWQAQFTYWRNWRAGDVSAVSFAQASCAIAKRPPPTWLCKAIDGICEWCMSRDDNRAYRRMMEDFKRWEAGELVRGRRPWDPRNYERKVRSDVEWVEAAKLVAGTDAEAGEQAVRKSHALIKRAGGDDVTLASYRREIKDRNRRRREQRKKTKVA